MLRALIDVWFIFAPSAGYILQVQEMTRTRRTDGYSLEGSLILLACNALRVIYFFGEPFAVALLLQSCVTILVQLALVLTVLKINVAHAVLAEELAKLPSWVPTSSSFASMPSLVNVAGGMSMSSMVSGVIVADDAASEGTPTVDDTTGDDVTGGSRRRPAKRSHASTHSGHHHHNHNNHTHHHGSKHPASKSPRRGGGGVATWTPRQFLMRFIIGFTSSFAVSMVAFMQIPGTAQLVGYLSMGVEATLVIPQLMLNRRRQSCEGLALSLVGNWILGDVVKTIYFIVLSQPAPFLACAISQLTLDGVLIYQLVAYRAPSPPATTAAALTANARSGVVTTPAGSPIPSPAAANAVATASHVDGKRHHRRHRRTMSLGQQAAPTHETVPLVSAPPESVTPVNRPSSRPPPSPSHVAVPVPAMDSPLSRKAGASPTRPTSIPALRPLGSTDALPVASLAAGAAAGAIPTLAAVDPGVVAEHETSVKSHSTLRMGDSTDSDLGFTV